MMMGRRLLWTPLERQLALQQQRQRSAATAVIPAVNRILETTSSTTTHSNKRSFHTTSSLLFSSPQLKLPSNLWIDPRSSFALPSTRSEKLVAAAAAIEKEEESASTTASIEEEDEQLDYDEDIDTDPTYMLATNPVCAIPLPERLTVPIKTLFVPDPSQLNTSASYTLHSSVFGRSPIRIDLLKRSVDYFRAKKRGRRTAVTKTISQVSGSGKKLRPQKGSGKARVGHSRPPHFRGGAKAHGPKNVTDYGNTKLNKKVRKLALAHALSQKLLEGNLIVLEQLYELPTHKTADLARRLSWLHLGGKHALRADVPTSRSALILDHYHIETNGDESQETASSHRGVPLNLWVGAQNIPHITVGDHHQANVYDILKHEVLVLTVAAVEQLEERLKHLP